MATYQQQATTAGTDRQTSKKAVASLVLGILGVLVAPIIFSTLAIIFGAIAAKETRRERGLGGRGMAIAGIVLGIVGLALGLLVTGLMIAGS